jgi:hypothetical protein
MNFESPKHANSTFEGKKSLISLSPPSLENTKGNEDVGKEMKKIDVKNDHVNELISLHPNYGS